VGARLRRDATLLAWHAWQRLDTVLPRPVRFALATALGEALYWALPNKRAAVLENMAHVLGPAAPPAEVRAVARRSFRNFAKYLSEFTHLPRWSAPDLEKLVSGSTGWGHIADALSDGKGVICITCHFGNWDVAGWYFGQRHRFEAIVEPLSPPELDDLVQGWRRAKHIGTIPLAQAPRGVLRALQQGGAVAIVVDRPVHRNGEGVPVRFFGEWTRVPAGTARFALRTGCPVIAAGVWRTERNTYHAFALPPHRFTPTADGALSGTQREQDEARVMQRIMGDVEQIVRGHPDQWYMFRRMWPRPPRPSGPPQAAGGAPDGTPSASRWTPEEAGRLLRRRLRELRLAARTRLFGAGVRLAETLPAPLLYRLARGAAGPLSLLPTPARRALRRNLGAVLEVPPDSPLLGPLVRGAYRTQCANYADLLRGRRLSGAEASARTVAEGEGWAPFRQAIAARRGALLVTAHLGRIELMSHFLGALGIPLTLPVERIEPPALLELVTSLRTRPGFTLVPSDLGLRPTLRALQRGHAVVLFADWDSTGHGVEVSFFGRPARLPAGPALLAVRTGAPLFVAFAFEGPSGQTVHATMGPPLEVQRSGDQDADVLQTTARLASSLEQAIRRYPQQWVMFHELWGAPGSTAIPPSRTLSA
jgi:lauroyl/myristoyl acyltransferase